MFKIVQYNYTGSYEANITILTWFERN